jgi:UDP-N-acetylglucosamine transferase subunit ALG13
VTTLALFLLGTDHHPFDRLVCWADEIARRDPGLRVVVQYGASRAPDVAEGHEYLPHDRILELVDAASAVVCHGGPGTIMDARGLGHVPVCVPRDPALGEHVDGHQLRFADLAEQAGVVTRATTLDDLGGALERTLARGEGERCRAVPVSPATEAARELLGRELDRLALHGPTSWRAPGPRRRRSPSVTV